MGETVKSIFKAVAITAVVIITAGAIAYGVFGASSFMGVAAAKGGFLASMGALVTSTSFTTALALSGAATLVGSVLAPDISVGSANTVNANLPNGTKVSGRGAVQPRQIVYGKCRVGGTITFMSVTHSTDGTNGHFDNEDGDLDGEKLCMFVVVSGHPITGFTKVYYNDQVLDTADLSHDNAGDTLDQIVDTEVGETVYYPDADELNDVNGVNGARFVKNNALFRFTFHDGTQTAHDGLARATLGSSVITDNFLLTNCAYFYFELIFDRQKNNSVPRLSFELQGKKIYDPRKDSTVTGGSGSHRAATSSTWEFSSNPALCLRDYLSDTTYGLSAEASEINDTNNPGGVQTAANVCDQDVVDNDSSVTANRYTANGSANFSSTGEDVVHQLLSSMAGKMTYTSGKFQVFAGATQTVDKTITEDDLLSPINITTNRRGGDLFNSVKAIYADAENDYIASETPVLTAKLPGTSTTYLSKDTPSGSAEPNYKKMMELRLPFTTNKHTAQRLAKVQILDQRFTQMVNVQLPIKYIQCQPNDWVQITYPNFDWTNKKFCVEEISLGMTDGGDDSPGMAAVNATLKEVDDGIFTFVSSDFTNPVADIDPSVFAEPPQGSITIPAPTGLTLTLSTEVQNLVETNYINLAWTLKDQNAETEIKMQTGGSGAYLTVGTAKPGEKTFKWGPAIRGQQYSFNIRHEIDGNFSTAAAASITVSPATTSPSAPSNLDVTDGSTNYPFQLTVEWQNPNIQNYWYTKVYRHTSATFTTSASSDNYLVASVAGIPNGNHSIIQSINDGMSAGQLYHYKLRGVLATGEHTAEAGPESGSFPGL